MSKKSKREKRIKKKTEKNYYRASGLFRDIGAVSFAEYLEGKKDILNDDLKTRVTHNLFPSRYDKKLEKELKLSKKYVGMGERSCYLFEELEKEENRYKDIKALVLE